jgi:uncharacterized protein YrzB (UPF0473 family)
MIQTDKFNVILDQFTGWMTSRDSDDLPLGKSPDLLNVRITGSHMRGALGYELIGTRSSTAGKITSQYTYNRNDGTQVMVRVKDDASSGTLEWYDATNDEWYILLASLTTAKIMGFAEFNTSTTNQMVCCNGVENMSVWTGATTRLTSAVTATDTDINVESTADFPATGTIIYNGTEIAYTSKTATTFVVASAHASAGANDGVAEAIDDSTHSAITKGNILLSAFDRLWIAGQPSAPNALDYSDEGAAFTYTGGSNRADSGTEDIYNIGGKITGLSNKGEEIIILGEDGAVAFSFIYPTSTTKAPSYREIFRAPGQGCVSSKSVFKVNNEIYFANKNGIVSISDAEGTERLISKSITRDILPTLKDYVFTTSSAIYYDKESVLLISCRSNEDFTGNDTIIGLEFYKNQNGSDTFGLVKFDWPVNDFAILADKLYFGSSLEMNSFRGFSTYQNDGSPRTVKYATQSFDFNNPFQEKGCRLCAIKGLIKDGTNIDVKILFNSGFKGELNKTIESIGDYVSSSVLNTIGAFANGTNPIGASIIEVSELKEFLVYLDLGVDYTWNEISLIFESQTDGGTFLISDIAMSVDEEGTAHIDKFTI